MSKLPHKSVSASVALVKRLKVAANDVELLREIIESNDSGSVAAAFAALLAGDSSPSPSGSSLRKKARNRTCPSLPTETFVEVALFADRDTLDAMQLVCSFLLNFIKERELTQLALRAIREVNIGRLLDSLGDNFDGWLPVVEIVTDGNHGARRGQELVPKSVHQLMPFVRTAFCELVRFDFDEAPEADPAFSEVCDMIFGDLLAPNTLVGTLSFIRMPWRCLEKAVRGIEAFKSVKNVIHGVRLIEFNSTFADGVRVNVGDALSFGFAEPTAGGDRCLLGVACEIGTDFLEQVKQKVVELGDARHVDFNYKLASVSQHVNSTGFENYQREDGRTWLVNDLENHVNVEVMQTVGLVEIHVFSSV